MQKIVTDKKRLSQVGLRISLEDSEVVARKMKFFLLSNPLGKKGVGLASNQLGLQGRVIFYLENRKWKFLINPHIIYQSTSSNLLNEGCLSFPNQFIKVERSDTIRVVADNLPDLKIFEGFTARIIQHEIDHLNGITMHEREVIHERA